MVAHWYSRGDLPPAGNPVLLDGSKPLPQFAGYSACWVNSGTAALALALMVARARRPEVATPRVVLPAYGCPDLVAAAEFAQLRPLLVDIRSDDPGYSLAALAQALNDDVVAVVAVNFLGIRERLDEIKELLAARSRALLIEDDAQWFPEPLTSHGMRGDLVCLSFGRGKPVSLLGGGALLVRDGSGLEIPRQSVEPAQEPGALLPLKMRVFNTVLDRRCYWLINRNPAIAVGQTVFKALPRISALDPLRSRLLGANVRAYLVQRRDAEAHWTECLSNSGILKPLDIDAERSGRLLRYPVLCSDASMRGVLLQRLHDAGSGVSAMYRCPLAQVSGVGGKVDVAGDCAGAAKFAARLLTLPTHRQVTQGDVDAAARVVGG